MSYTYAYHGKQQDSVDYVDGNAITTRSGGNLAWRCNNPGLIPACLDASSNGGIGQALRVAVFPDKDAGTQALKAHLKNPRFDRMTVQQLMERFVPSYEIPAPEWDTDKHQMVSPWLEPETGLDVQKVPQEDQRDTLADFIIRFNGWEAGNENEKELEPEAAKRTAAIMSGQNVIINGRSAVHKDSAGVLNTVDVCLTPSASGATPIPYPNIAMSSDADKTASSVKINGNPACHIKSVFKKSSGDEPGSKKGVKSGEIQGEAKFIVGSNDVLIEGQKAVRSGDMMVSNKENTPPAPLMQPSTPPPQILSMEEKEVRDLKEESNLISVDISGDGVCWGDQIDSTVELELALEFQVPSSNNLSSEELNDIELVSWDCEETEAKPIVDYNDVLASFVEQLEGKNYVLGKDGPDAYDCSGTLVAAIRSINSNFGDYTAHQLFQRFSLDGGDKARGTLIFYDYTSDGHVDHVTTILNDSSMLHPSSGAGTLQIKPLSYLNSYTTRRGGKIYFKQLNWDLILRQ